MSFFQSETQRFDLVQITDLTNLKLFRLNHKQTVARMEFRTHVFIKQFAGFLFDGVNELYLPCRKAHQQRDALRRGRQRIGVVTRGKRSLIYPLVYGFAQISGLVKSEISNLIYSYA